MDPLPAPSLTPTPFPDTAAEIQRESIRLRCRQSVQAMPVMAAVLVAIGFLVWSETDRELLAIWIALAFGSILMRSTACARILDLLPGAGPGELARIEARLAAMLLGETAAMGSAMWLVAAHGTEEIQFFVTLALCFYAIASMVTASSHVASFSAGVAANLGQAMLFWLLSGPHGARIAVSLGIIGSLLVLFARENSRSFATSVRMRVDNLRLVGQLEREKQAAERALAQAREANRAKSRFLAAASHDLRQPLHALSLYAGVLLRQTAGGPQAATARRIEDTIGVLDGLFGNLLDLSRFDAGAVEPELADCSIEALFERLDAEFQPQMQARGLGWRIRPLPVCVRSDEMLLERALRNLLNNAARFTRSGQVELAAVERDGLLVLEVRDTGPGIDEADRARIFDEFVQLNNPARDADQGVGLGLAIVNRIRLLLDVKVRVAQVEPTGAAFGVEFGPDQWQRRAAGNPLAAAGQGEQAMLDLRVWAVDDNRLVLDALALQLESWGCAVLAAASPERLRAALREGVPSPDAVILDDMLGNECGGLEFARWLSRSVDPSRILIVTGNIDPARLGLIERSGFPVLSKPVSPKRLHDQLVRITSLCAAAD
jgi:signal transduction histidine kinase/CheY-like chemotaxis protein